MNELIEPLSIFFSKKFSNVAQFAAVGFHLFCWIILPLMSLWLPAYILFFTRFWPLIIAYAIWFVFDFNTPARGSRPWKAFQNSVIWKHFADYFPISLKKTADLPPNQNYIMGCHPHGILSIGSFTHLCTTATGFQDIFPGLEPTILTLKGQFMFPFRREIGMALGGVQSCSESLEYLLRTKPTGRLIGIVIGGAEEALDAHNGKNAINILNRRGFCRYALKHGVFLVPSYSFGENDIYTQSGNDRGTNLRSIQTKIKNIFGFCPPLFYGRGFFRSFFGLFPRRHPITTVVGAPIAVQKTENPTQEEIDNLHKEYIIALKDLFNRHKSSFNISDEEELNIL